jgi:hypothetical protein
VKTTALKSRTVRVITSLVRKKPAAPLLPAPGARSARRINAVVPVAPADPARGGRDEMDSKSTGEVEYLAVPSREDEAAATAELSPHSDPRRAAAEPAAPAAPARGETGASGAKQKWALLKKAVAEVKKEAAAAGEASHSSRDEMEVGAQAAASPVASPFSLARKAMMMVPQSPDAGSAERPRHTSAFAQLMKSKVGLPEFQLSDQHMRSYHSLSLTHSHSSLSLAAQLRQRRGRAARASEEVRVHATRGPR